MTVLDVSSYVAGHNLSMLREREESEKEPGSRQGSQGESEISVLSMHRSPFELSGEAGCPDE